MNFSIPRGSGCPPSPPSSARQPQVCRSRAMSPCLAHCRHMSCADSSSQCWRVGVQHRGWLQALPLEHTTLLMLQGRSETPAADPPQKPCCPVLLVPALHPAPGGRSHPMQAGSSSRRALPWPGLRFGSVCSKPIQPLVLDRLRLGFQKPSSARAMALLLSRHSVALPVWHCGEGSSCSKASQPVASPLLPPAEPCALC